MCQYVMHSILGTDPFYNELSVFYQIFFLLQYYKIWEVV